MNNVTASPPEQYNPFSIGNIITYMEQTDPDKWATDVVRTADGSNCFFGHLFNFAGGTLWDLFEECWATTFMVYSVNDGSNPAYPQATAKERVVAYLKDLRDGKAQTTQQLMAEEFEASCNEQIEMSNASRERKRAALAVATGQKQQHVISKEKADGSY
jgi:hypothetical protein